MSSINIDGLDPSKEIIQQLRTKDNRMLNTYGLKLFDTQSKVVKVSLSNPKAEVAIGISFFYYESLYLNICVWKLVSLLVARCGNETGYYSYDYLREAYVFAGAVC